jgi:palmitoyl-protein thioesterase
LHYLTSTLTLGLGDNFAADGLRSVGELAGAVNPGTLVYFIQMASDPPGDQSATFFGNVTEQVAKACADIAAHPILSTAPANSSAPTSSDATTRRCAAW